MPTENDWLERDEGRVKEKIQGGESVILKIVKILSFVFNTPWTLVGILFALLALPKYMRFHKNPFTLVLKVRSFWFLSWLPIYKGIRGMTSGNIVLLGENSLPNDLEHELVHVRQSEKAPLIQPFLYAIESMKNGYKNNKYEVEAYRTTNSVYLDHS